MHRILPITASLMLLAGCQQGAGYQENPNTYKGAAAGAAIGGLAGSMESREYAAVGAGLGALAGGAVGQYMDRQEQQMRQELQGSGVDVVRQGDNILLNMPSSITFAYDSSTVQPQFTGTLGEIAGVLKQYPQTRVDVIGHTDSTGDESYNQKLSVERALAVASHLQAQGVASQRLNVVGRGESQPVATNNTEAGRAQNRRVEIKITPITQ